MDNKTRSQLKGLAIYQIAGGLLGIAVLLWVLFSGGIAVTQPVLRASLFAAVLYVFSALCGWMLLRRARRGLVLSLVSQLLQVVYFAFGSYSFQYVSGLRIGLGFDMVGSWTFKFRVALSSFQFGFGAGQKFIGINLVALFLIFWIEQLLERVKTEDKV